MSEWASRTHTPILCYKYRTLRPIIFLYMIKIVDDWTHVKDNIITSERKTIYNYVPFVVRDTLYIVMHNMMYYSAYTPNTAVYYRNDTRIHTSSRRNILLLLFNTSCCPPDSILGRSYIT